jgi:hypothetical protein
VAGGIPVRNIARWSGSSWAALGEGTNDAVRAFAVYGNDLIVAGAFDRAGTVPVHRIARWHR